MIKKKKKIILILIPLIILILVIIGIWIINKINYDKEYEIPRETMQRIIKNNNALEYTYSPILVDTKQPINKIIYDIKKEILKRDIAVSIFAIKYLGIGGYFGKAHSVKEMFESIKKDAIKERATMKVEDIVIKKITVNGVLVFERGVYRIKTIGDMNGPYYVAVAYKEGMVQFKKKKLKICKFTFYKCLKHDFDDLVYLESIKDTVATEEENKWFNNYKHYWEEGRYNYE